MLLCDIILNLEGRSLKIMNVLFVHKLERILVLKCFF